MTARIKTTMHDQSGVFYVMVLLMMIFFAVHMVTSALQVLGHTPTQIGGDISVNTFRELFIGAMLVFRAESKSLMDRVVGNAEPGSDVKAAISVTAPSEDSSR